MITFVDCSTKHARVAAASANRLICLRVAFVCIMSSIFRGCVHFFAWIFAISLTAVYSNCCFASLSVVCGWLKHKVRPLLLNVFEFRPDRTNSFGATPCPWASCFFHRHIIGKWGLHACVFSFDRIFVNRSGNQDRKTSHTSSNSVRIGSVSSELHSLEGQNFSMDLNRESARSIGQSWSCMASVVLGEGCIRVWKPKNSHRFIIGKMFSPRVGLTPYIMYGTDVSLE